MLELFYELYKVLYKELYNELNYTMTKITPQKADKNPIKNTSTNFWTILLNLEYYLCRYFKEQNFIL